MKTKILTGDVRQVLKRQPSNSFDACLCDPPYGLSFMGKAWDHGVPGAEVWAEVLRVLKPGAPLLAFGGTRTFHRLACAIEDAGFILSDTLCWLHGQGFPKGHAQLKPAWEPITLAWKKGPRVLAIDAGRIGTSKRVPGGISRTNGAVYGLGLRTETGMESGHNPNLGRWPANVLLDEEAAAALDDQSGTLKSGARQGGDRIVRTVFEGGASRLGGSCDATSGGASRFFYCAKASRSERNAGLEGMPLRSNMRVNGPRHSEAEKYATQHQNTHPTVKPLKLTEYLARIILPPERDTPRRLLIPFSGSGSECLGAKRAGWDEITGIEISPEYAGIAKARLKAA